MHGWPDAGTLRAFLARAHRRRAAGAALEGAAAGAVAGAAAAIVVRDAGLALGLGLAAVACGAALRVWWSRRTGPGVAYAVEARAPECRNVVITAAELLDRPTSVPAAIGERVCRDAAAAVRRLDAARLFPVRRAAAMLVAGAAAWGLAAWLVPGRSSPAAAAGVRAATSGPAILGVTAQILPPAYAGRLAETLEDPSEIRALTGSTIELHVRAAAATVRLEGLDGTSSLSADDSGRFAATLDVVRSGFLAIEPVGPDGTTGARGLVTIVAEPDQAPRVRLTAPGQDLFLPDASSRLAIAVEADDDFGLSTLAVTYTHVTGSGENFDFATGDVPLQVSRERDRAWTASGTLDLGTLELEPGDMVVYRGIAADRRPGAPPVESDAFIIEIMAPGEAAAAGFAIDDQQDRYALSQRMVLIKTERLAARRPAIAPAELLETAHVIAAEQRQVRAEFVFMMGGELTDFAEDADPFMLHEEDEAHGEADIAAGRLVNQGRAELTRAVRAMSLAAAALVDGNLDDALEAERVALEALQKAFASSRYILRALTERESIDLDRRLSGTFSDVARGAFSRPELQSDQGADALRGVLADLLALTALPPDARPAARAVGLAQRILTIDPDREDLRAVAGALTDAARAIEAADAGAAAGHLDRAATSLSVATRALSSESPGTPTPGSRTSQLLGARVDALRRGGGQR